jgi:transcriptional regulator with XRE-family HTH domain
MKPPNMTVRELRRNLGISQTNFSRLTGYSLRAVAAWERDKPLSDASRQRMLELQRLHAALSRVMKPEFIGEWMLRPNEGLSGFKPLELVERGEVDRLWRMIFELESGVPA